VRGNRLWTALAVNDRLPYATLRIIIRTTAVDGSQNLGSKAPADPFRHKVAETHRFATDNRHLAEFPRNLKSFFTRLKLNHWLISRNAQASGFELGAGALRLIFPSPPLNA
jgi:hypothetical protein